MLVILLQAGVILTGDPTLVILPLASTVNGLTCVLLLLYVPAVTPELANVKALDLLPEPSNDGRLYISVRNNSTSVFAYTYNDTTNERLKIAVAYSSGDIDYFVNGVKVDSSTTTFSFSHTLERVLINGSNQENNQILVFKTKLTDSECIALTTL